MEQTFEQVLDALDYFDGEVAPDNIETCADLVWGSDVLGFTEEGRAAFADILALPAEVSPSGDVIRVHTNASGFIDPDCRLDRRVDEFVAAAAGYIPEDEYALWFAEL